MKVIYVAGPFRAPTMYGIVQNTRRAEALALEVCNLGHIALCPHLNTQNFHGVGTDQFWLDATLELMRRCDAVILVPGWQSSEGTKGEIAEANRLGMPVFHTINALSDWLKGA